MERLRKLLSVALRVERKLSSVMLRLLLLVISICSTYYAIALFFSPSRNVLGLTALFLIAIVCGGAAEQINRLEQALDARDQQPQQETLKAE